MSLESTVGIAKVGTKSLRATVPEGIVAFLGIKEGDKLQWTMEIQNNARIAVVKKKDDALAIADEYMKEKEQKHGRT